MAFCHERRGPTEQALCLVASASVVRASHLWRPESHIVEGSGRSGGVLIDRSILNQGSLP